MPAECIVYFNPLARRSFWTSTTSVDTDAEPVPTYIDPIRTCQLNYSQSNRHEAQKGSGQPYRDDAEVGIACSRSGDGVVIHD